MLYFTLKETFDGVVMFLHDATMNRYTYEHKHLPKYVHKYVDKYERN